MARSPKITACLVAFVALACMSNEPANAFHLVSSPLATRNNHLSTAPSPIYNSPSSVVLEAKKNPASPEPEREKNSGLGLLLLYMTPWKNPNSLFVYMLGGLYFLGKYSEAQSAAKAAAATAGM